MPSQINAVTKDPERKMKKQIRKAKSKGDLAKVEELQNNLSDFLKREEINAKNKEAREKKKEKKQKMNNLSDDDFMNQCQKDNKKLKDKDELEKKERENKKKSIENMVRRAKILQAKKEKEEQTEMSVTMVKIQMDLII